MGETTKEMVHMVKSVEKTFGILEYLAEHQEPASLGEISESMSTNKSTVRRFMLSLKKLGYIDQDPDSRLYKLSPKITLLGRGIQEDITLTSLAAPYMDNLAHVTGETVNLGFIEGAEVYYIDKRESPHRLRLCVEVGGVGPIHATALGKAMLAYLPKEEVDRIFSSGAELTKLTRYTITTWAEFDRELELIRTEGVSYDREEMIDGLYCVGAPIFLDEDVIAAVSISTPTTRMNEQRIELFIQLVRDQSTKLSKELSLSRSFITPGNLRK
jgi:IclR family acetate operon transcriptional repressor